VLASIVGELGVEDSLSCSCLRDSSAAEAEQNSEIRLIVRSDSLGLTTWDRNGAGDEAETFAVSWDDPL